MTRMEGKQAGAKVKLRLERDGWAKNVRLVLVSAGELHSVEEFGFDEVGELEEVAEAIKTSNL